MQCIPYASHTDAVLAACPLSADMPAFAMSMCQQLTAMHLASFREHTDTAPACASAADIPAVAIAHVSCRQMHGASVV